MSIFAFYINTFHKYVENELELLQVCAKEISLKARDNMGLNS
jgi:hypothetical protein